jgi:hypothetical protein
MENLEFNKDLEKEDQNEATMHKEGEESPFLSLIIKDLNDFYIRYDVNYKNLNFYI